MNLVGYILKASKIGKNYVTLCYTKNEKKSRKESRNNNEISLVHC